MMRLWGEDERRQVASMLTAGGSAGTIARKLGITRNQVLGRIVRDDELHHLIAKRTTPRRKCKPASPQLGWGRHQPKPFVYKGWKFEPPPVRVAPRMRFLSLTDLADSGECRWPVQESAATVGGFLFCAAPCSAEKSYCSCHMRLAYRSAWS
jgi:hypothetical protein